MLTEADLIIFGGGGLFVDKHIKALFLWWQQLRLALKTGAGVVLLSQSISIRSWLARALWVPLLKKVNKISVRDHSSQEQLKDLGISSEVVPDVSFLAPKTHLSRYGSKKLLCVSLCQWGLSHKRLQHLKTFLSSFSDEWSVMGLVFQSKGDDDRRVFERLHLPFVSGSEVPRMITESSFVIAMRYHAALFSLRSGVPFLALEYQPKLRFLMKDLGLEEYGMDMKDLSWKKLQDHFRGLTEKSAILRERLNSTAKAWEIQALEAYSRILLCCEEKRDQK